MFRLRICLTVLFAAMCAGNSHADLRSDLLALTGNVRTKLVWRVWPWCNEDYTPNQQRSTEGENYRLLVFDTEQGAIRVFDSTLSSAGMTRFTRKNGDYVIWSDSKARCSWIRDFAGTAPRRKLIENSPVYRVVHCRYDEASATEYIYILGKDSTVSTTSSLLYEVPLTSDYQADLSKKRLLPIEGDINSNLTFSQDGRYIGCEIPWPFTMIVEAETDTRHERHRPGDIWGCMPNIAPDNSYRFWYLNDAHKVVRMWDAGLSGSTWDVDISKDMPIIDPVKGGDCHTPRWSNDVRFFVNGSTLDEDYSFNDDFMFSQTADQVKAAPLSKVGHFMLGKFSADFRSVEQYVLVGGNDIREFHRTGDAFIGDASTAAAQMRHGSATSNARPVIMVDCAGRIIDLHQGRKSLNVTPGVVIVREERSGKFITRECAERRN